MRRKSIFRSIALSHSRQYIRILSSKKACLRSAALLSCSRSGAPSFVGGCQQTRTTRSTHVAKALHWPSWAAKPRHSLQIASRKRPVIRIRDVREMAAAVKQSATLPAAREIEIAYCWVRARVSESSAPATGNFRLDSIESKSTSTTLGILASAKKSNRTSSLMNSTSERSMFRKNR